MTIPESTKRFMQAWHAMLEQKNPALLEPFTSDDVVIRSPMFFKPKGPKAYVMAILGSVNQGFQDFRYTKEWIDGRDILLEFEASIEGKGLKGIDRITLDENGRMIELEVLIRPFNALQALGEHVMRSFANEPR